MPTPFVVSLAVVVVAVLAARFVLAGLPLRRVAVPMTIVDLVLAVIGVAGLVFHCGAMFFPAVTHRLPGGDGLINQVNAFGTASVAIYVVSAALVVFALRHQHPIPLIVVSLALLAVGVTMYDGGSLHRHLTTIFVAVVVLACVTSTLVLPAHRRRAAQRP
ncbi:MAG: hypothetical protein ACR2P2_13920 [Nakamurella sp.]